MVKKIINIAVIVFILLIGCNNFLFKKFMENGKLSIVNGQYYEAKGYFKQALDIKSDNMEAKSLYKQTDKLLELITFKEDGNYQEAMELCLNINNIDSKDKLIKNIAVKLKNQCRNELDKSKKYEERLNARIEEGRLFMQQFNYSKAKAIFMDIIKEIKNLEDYYLQLDEVKSYLSICEGK